MIDLFPQYQIVKRVIFNVSQSQFNELILSVQNKNGYINSSGDLPVHWIHWGLNDPNEWGVEVEKWKELINKGIISVEDVKP
jgi:hypothetical protein